MRGYLFAVLFLFVGAGDAVHAATFSTFNFRTGDYSTADNGAWNFSQNRGVESSVLIRASEYSYSRGALVGGRSLDVTRSRRYGLGSDDPAKGRWPSRRVNSSGWRSEALTFEFDASVRPVGVHISTPAFSPACRAFRLFVDGRAIASPRVRGNGVGWYWLPKSVAGRVVTIGARSTPPRCPVNSFAIGSLKVVHKHTLDEPDVPAVPLPAAGWLLFLGIAWMAFLGRQKAKAAI